MRVQFDFSEERIDELKALMAETGSDTYKGLINNALSVFEWAVKEVKSGLNVAAINEKNRSYRVLVMPALDRVAQVANRSGVPKEVETTAAGRS